MYLHQNVIDADMQLVISGKLVNHVEPFLVMVGDII